MYFDSPKKLKAVTFSYAAGLGSCRSKRKPSIEGMLGWGGCL